MDCLASILFESLSRSDFLFVFNGLEICSFSLFIDRSTLFTELDLEKIELTFLGGVSWTIVMTCLSVDLERLISFSEKLLMGENIVSVNFIVFTDAFSLKNFSSKLFSDDIKPTSSYVILLGFILKDFKYLSLKNLKILRLVEIDGNNLIFSLIFFFLILQQYKSHRVFISLSEFTILRVISLES
eukprot:NODE_232_length_12051_cov_1.040997.p7 type:complete len:185 gc:universal NODE_232_length_12051_cov_1.040997:11940-11386(-)